MYVHDSSEYNQKHLFREPQMESTSNNPVKDIIIAQFFRRAVMGCGDRNKFDGSRIFMLLLINSWYSLQVVKMHLNALTDTTFNKNNVASEANRAVELHGWLG